MPSRRHGLRFVSLAIGLLLAAELGCSSRVIRKRRPMVRQPVIPSTTPFTLSPEELTDLERRWVGYDMVVLYREEIVEDSNRTVATEERVRYLTQRAVVLDAAGPNTTSVSIPVPVEHQLRVFDVQIASPGGVVRRLGLPEVRWERGPPGSSRAVLDYGALARGSAIDMRVSVGGPRGDGGGGSEVVAELELRVPCHKLVFRWAHPASMLVDVRRIAPELDLPLMKGHTDGKRSLTYSAVMVPPRRRGEHRRLFVGRVRGKRYLRTQTYAYGSIVASEKVGKTLMTTGTWRMLGEKARRQFANVQGPARRALEAEARRLADGFNDPPILAAIFRSWLLGEFALDESVAGESTYTVWQGRVASRRHLAGLLLRMLEAVDVPAQMAFVQSPGQDWFDDRFVSLWQLPEVAVVLETGHLVAPYSDAVEEVARVRSLYTQPSLRVPAVKAPHMVYPTFDPRSRFNPSRFE